jgi:hypothetical protein
MGSQLRYTVYPMAPITSDQLIVMLTADSAFADTPVGAAGTDIGAEVFAETGEDWALSPALLLADTL